MMVGQGKGRLAMFGLRERSVWSGREGRWNASRARLFYAALLALSTLSACASGDIPEEMLVLPPRPEIPAPGSSDNAVARYILDAEAWSETAIRRMAAIREIVGR